MGLFKAKTVNEEEEETSRRWRRRRRSAGGAKETLEGERERRCCVCNERGILNSAERGLLQKEMSPITGEEETERRCCVCNERGILN